MGDEPETALRFQCGTSLKCGCCAMSPFVDLFVVTSAPEGREGSGKLQVLFNYCRARETSDSQVIVVEGFFDCLRVHQAGFPCVVALVGARLSPAQTNLLAGRSSSPVDFPASCCCSTATQPV